jgi:hypothetical protein
MNPLNMLLIDSGRGWITGVLLSPVEKECRITTVEFYKDLNEKQDFFKTACISASQ